MHLNVIAPAEEKFAIEGEIGVVGGGGRWRHVDDDFRGLSWLALRAKG